MEWIALGTAVLVVGGAATWWCARLRARSASAQSAGPVHEPAPWVASVQEQLATPAPPTDAAGVTASPTLEAEPGAPTDDAMTTRDVVGTVALVTTDSELARLAMRYASTFDRVELCITPDPAGIPADVDAILLDLRSADARCLRASGHTAPTAALLPFDAAAPVRIRHDCDRELPLPLRRARLAATLRALLTPIEA